MDLHRLTTPPSSPPAGQRSRSHLPSTPEREGNNSLGKPSTPRHGEATNASNATLTSSTVTLSASLASSTLLTSSSFDTFSSFAALHRKVVIRADPSVNTCFDPADKELYDLWSPKRWCGDY
ncbi:uncharacterized protein LAESUDRAFT_718729 [Laetiporus sulphureus 93-53]|uniref:Uncharacterized protein n=1 Tax=Laetiporus sulphureus 93-53 TaxID=1314785 RepID=A0A165I1J4_9APHY|nr:uncharacterized protein LAESUDRAFT_718729 [Laetiporus sulphureus 93-53]KZT12471.1 hypothetical protein LAESUDRAFT_718729 [Laetiporus sulphureus 93-53]